MTASMQDASHLPRQGIVPRSKDLAMMSWRPRRGGRGGLASANVGAAAVSHATEKWMSRRESRQPIVIAHRGASGYVPEHTLAAYALAIEMGADYIEPDLVMTKDGVLVARHENEISGTTDIADHPEFASRKTQKTIDGVQVEGWFSEDFTFLELTTLRARERLPRVRAASGRLDGFFRIPAFTEVLDLVRGADFRFGAQEEREKANCRRVGVCPETKHPTYFAGIGLAMEELLVRQLASCGFSRGTGTVFIQSFEVANLKRLRTMTDLPLVQLLDATGAPYDLRAEGDPRTYADLAKPAGLADIAVYADGIAIDKSRMIPRNADHALGAPTQLVADAHAASLVVYGWTFRAENSFLPREFRSAGGETDFGDLDGEIATFLALGMDGFFTDQPNIGVRVRDAFPMP
jgi:glycerophosphoryl diester phosphodiesterase